MIKKEDVRGLIELTRDKAVLEALWELYERLVQDEVRDKSGTLNKETIHDTKQWRCHDGNS